MYINRIAVILTPPTIVDKVNQFGVSERQSDGIQFTNIDGRVTIYDLDLNCDDDDSNAFDESFERNDKYQKEFINETKTSEQGLTTNKTQDEHFQDPIQQHNTPDTKPTNNASFSSSKNMTPQTPEC